MKFLGASHPVKIKNFLTYDCIIVEYLIELAQLEQHNLLIVCAFYAPVLSHCWSEVFPLLLRNVKSCGVILRMIRSTFLSIKYVFLLDKVGSRITDLI